MTSKRILTSDERKQQLARIHSFLDELKARALTLKADLPTITNPSLKSLWDAETKRQKRHV